MSLPRLAPHASLAPSGRPADPLPAVSAGGPGVGPVVTRPSSLLAGFPAGERFPSSDLPYLAAWVPADDPARPWDPTPAPARWLLEQAERLNLKLTLVSGAPLTGALPPALRYFQLRAEVGSRRPATGRAVLAYLPSLRTAARAFHLADGGAVAVVEGPAALLSGWAAASGALNLLTGRCQGALPTATSACFRDLVQSLDDGAPASDRTEAVLAALREGAGAGLSADYLAGCLLAYGCRPRDIRRLLQIAGQVRSADPREACESA